MNSAQEDDVISNVTEIAARLKVNPQTVRNWITRDELRAVRVGARRVRILQADLDSFLAVCRRHAAPATHQRGNAPPSSGPSSWPQRVRAPEPRWPPIARLTWRSRSTHSSPPPSRCSTPASHKKYRRLPSVR